MKSTLTALILIATFALSACSRTDVEPIAQAAFSSAHATEPKAPLYPPIQADAKDGAVFEYY
jgi:hypothetical protein